MAIFSNSKKRSKIFWIIVIILFVLMLTELGLRYYDRWHGQKRVEELARELERIESERTAALAADTIGGETPQETLRMFIDAVEAGDYELESKYFVIEKQEEAKKELRALKENNNLNMYLGILEKAEANDEIKNGHFRMISKLESGPPDYFVDFFLYPSGNWKIEEI